MSLLVASVVLAPQLIGGVTPWAILLTGGVTLAVLVVLLTTGEGRDGPVPLIAWAMALPLAWTVVQALPLPCALVRAIAPDSAARLADARAVLGLKPPSSCTLSMAPGATHEEIIKGFALNAAFVAALCASRRGFRSWMYRAVAAAALLMALVALGHAAAGAEEVFGGYQPVEVGHPTLLAPLLNLNSLGGFLAMGIPVLIALSLDDRHPGVRAAMVVGVGVLATTALMTRSRGAAGAVALGVGLYAMLSLYSWRRRKVPMRPGWVRLTASAAIAVLLCATAYGFYEAVAQDVAEGGWNKLAHIERSARFDLEHPLVGIGRGAFASVFTAQAGTYVRFDFVECFPVQWAAGWGLPVTLLTLLGVAPPLWRQLQRPTSRRRLGAAVGVVTLATQNLVDLGFELLGVALVASVLLAAATAPSPRSEVGDRPPRVSLRHFTLALAACAGLALSVLGPGITSGDSLELERELRAQLSSADRAAFRATLTRATLLHPSEPVFAVLGAGEALRHGDPSAPRWINRGMRLAPGWSGPHLQAVQWLWNLGRRDQAMLELRTAGTLSLKGLGDIVCRMAVAEPAKIATAAPEGPGRQRFLEHAAGCLGADADARARFDRALGERFPDLPLTRLRQGIRMLREGDVGGATGLLERLVQAEPDYLDALRALVNARLAAGRPKGAAAAVDAARARFRPTDLLPLRARAQAAAGDETRMRETLGRLRGLSTTDTRRLAATYVLEGQLEEQLGNRGQALAAYEAAYRIKSDSGVLRHVADVAQKLGDIRRAVQAYRELCRAAANSGPDCRRLEALRAPALTP